jgi:ATP-binding cassette subfamily C (CFTR/MRP) protein 2
MESRKGLETEITENGENLSVGERQLVSIARAVLKPTKIVLVDEATANIDVRTESVIYKAMNESFKNSTVITVAHRLNTVINSDRILVLEGGMLKEFDNPQ